MNTLESCINLSISTQPSHSFQQFKHTTHGRFLSNSHNPGLILTVSKIQQWAVHGQPTRPTSVPLCEPEIHGHFRPHTHQNMIWCINHNPSSLNSPWTVQNGSKNSKNYVPSLGTDKTAPHGLSHTQPSTKYLNKR